MSSTLQRRLLAVSLLINLGVLVAAKYARELNALPRETLPLGEEKKLTTRSLEALTSGNIEFRLVKRRRREE